MPTDEGFLVGVVNELLATLQPLERLTSSSDGFAALLSDFGWPPPPGYDPTPIVTMFNLAADLDAATTLIDRINDGELATNPTLLKDVTETLSNIISKIKALVNLSPPPEFPAPFNSQDFWRSFPLDLLGYLFIVRLRRTRPSLSALLDFTGVISELEVPAAPPTPANLRRRLLWGKLGRVLSDPVGLVREYYHWNDPANPLDHSLLLMNVGRLLSAIRPIELTYPHEGLVDEYYSSANSARSQLREVSGPLITGFNASRALPYSFGMFAFPIPADGMPDGPPIGLVLGSEFEGDPSLDMIVGPLLLALRGGFDSTTGFRLEFRPGSITSRLAGGSTTFNAEASLAKRRPDPQILIGASDSHRVQVKSVTTALRAMGKVSDLEFVVELAFEELEFVLQMSDGDSFLQRLLGGAQQSVSTSLRVSWSSKHGLAFSGGAKLSVTIGIHASIAAVRFETLTIDVSVVETSRFEIEAGLTGNATIGPVIATIDRIGVRVLLDALGDNDPPGTFGDLDLQFGFKPPNGLGIIVDAGSITGAGSLSFDEPNGRYSGWLHLKTQDITFSAFGLLDTKLPGGESGFSFLILIATTFNPPIQLGLGFALRGVGGLVGIHRDVNTEVLQAGLRSHTLDHLLFPENPERDAPLIISDLRSVFPPREGSYVFGPLAIITWAELIEAELGLVLHIADSVRLILLGQIRALIPKEGPILKLRLDIVGVLDFDQKLLDIRSTIYDSSVAGYPLSGEAALLLKWGNDPVFVFAIGGLHPDFSPPPGFPKLAPLTLALSDSDNPRLTLKMYLAVTSNTIQVGAEAELSARGGGFTLYGMLKFDALIDLSSFTFKINFKVKVELRRGKRVFAGIRLKATLTGPGEWHIWGEACISILFFDICVDFDETFGDPVALIARKLINPFPLLKAAIELGRNWSAALPAAAARGITMVPPEDGDQAAPGQKQTFVDPMGVVTLHQSVLPFNRKIAKFGEGKVDGPNQYKVTRVTIGDLPDPTPVDFSLSQDFFAPGQFEFLTDAQKLSRSSFEKMNSGVAIGSQAVTFGANCESDVRYKTIILDSPFDRREPPWFYYLAGDSYLAMNEIGAAARGPFQKTGDLKFAPAPRLPSFVALIGDEYVVASTNDLSVRSDITGDPVTKGAAFLALDDYLAAHPAERGRLQVVPRHELAGGSI